ncbi:hypothetical protein MJO28_011054 [Puccinia striiformis f. sp. tritici]|uniref:Uncharacterized protein n=1 Tax=Puccinia striiformis f. sp. tritici TaxID=168172 RepID=A0ACC0E1L9_9BASI|nr:hypothetical protein MJO28_011054 [Puccinia striiformis f. sp. tritici]
MSSSFLSSQYGNIWLTSIDGVLMKLGESALIAIHDRVFDASRVSQNDIDTHLFTIDPAQKHVERVQSKRERFSHHQHSFIDERQKRHFFTPVSSFR